MTHVVTAEESKCTARYHLGLPFCAGFPRNSEFDNLKTENLRVHVNLTCVPSGLLKIEPTRFTFKFCSNL